jgi:hypothetical protein
MTAFEKKMPRLVAELHDPLSFLGSVIGNFRITAAAGKSYDT